MALDGKMQGTYQNNSVASAPCVVFLLVYPPLYCKHQSTFSMPTSARFEDGLHSIHSGAPIHLTHLRMSHSSQQ